MKPTADVAGVEAGGRGSASIWPAAGRSAHTIARQYHLRLPIAAALDAILHDGAEPRSLEKALTGGR
jgi:hypothetical protein